MAKDFTKVYDENARLKAENTKLKEELKGKDELLFAYESVRAPVNPLYAENAKLKAELKTKDKEYRPDIIRAKFKTYCTDGEGGIRFDAFKEGWSEGFMECKRLLEADTAILKEFIRHVINIYSWGIEVDGGDAQDKALELGLIEEHIATEKDVNPEFDEYNVGDTIYRFSDILKGE